MIKDEIQSEIGRTGKFFAVKHCSIEPDIICLAKSLAICMPFYAVKIKNEITDSLPEGSIESTYVRNPITCRAALEVIKIIEEENLLERALKIGELLKKEIFRNKEKTFSGRKDSGHGSHDGHGIVEE